MPGGGTARWAVLNLDNQVTAELASRTRAGIAWFTRSPLDSKRPYGAFLREERIFWREDGREVEIMPVKEIPLKGAHNQENVMAAVSVARLAGADAESIRRGVQKFKQKDGTEKTNDFVVAWINHYGPKQTRVFSTTIGHNNATVEDPRYLDLVTRGVLWATGHLKDNGTPARGYGAAGK